MDKIGMDKVVRIGMEDKTDQVDKVFQEIIMVLVVKDGQETICQLIKDGVDKEDKQDNKGINGKAG